MFGLYSISKLAPAGEEDEEWWGITGDFKCRSSGKVLQKSLNSVLSLPPKSKSAGG